MGETMKITCFFNNDGKDLQEIIEKFLIEYYYEFYDMEIE